MQSKATSVQQYLAELTPERRAALESVRAVILENLDRRGFAEGMQYGMIGYFVPHSVFPAGYHCDPKQPLPFAALASQKNYMSLYLMGTYGSSEHETWLRAEWAKTGKKLDMGKSCIRFNKVEDLALDVIGAAIKRIPVEAFVASYVANAQPATRASKVVAKVAAAKKVARKAGASKTVAARR